MPSLWNYHYDLGFKINGHAIPDPSGFKYSVADVDVSAERDTTGLLHRQMVATKHNVGISYNTIDYSTAEQILQWLNSPSFTLTYPDPQTGALRTGKYYVGDRSLEAIWTPTAQKWRWIGSLSFDMIEY